MKAGTSDEMLRELARELGVCLLLSDGRLTNGEEDGVRPEAYRPAAVLVQSADELDLAARRLTIVCNLLLKPRTGLILLNDPEFEFQLRLRLSDLRDREGLDSVPRTATTFFKALKARHRELQDEDALEEAKKRRPL